MGASRPNAHRRPQLHPDGRCLSFWIQFAPSDIEVASATFGVSNTTKGYTTGDQAVIGTPVIDPVPVNLSISVSDGGVPFQLSPENNDTPSGTWTATVRNFGTATSSGTTTVSVEGEPNFVSYSGSGWSCTGSFWSCTNSTPIPPGGSLPPLTFSVVAPGTYQGGYSEDNASFQVSNPGNDTSGSTSAWIMTPVVGAAPTDLVVNVADGGSPLLAGGQANYTATARNSGTAAYPNSVQLSYSVAGVTLTPVGDGWTCDATAETCSWPGPVSAGEVLPPISFTGPVPSVQGGSQLEFSALINNQDDYDANNQAEIDTPVIRAPTDLVANVADGGVPFTIGGKAFDTVTVRNVGSQPYSEPVEIQYVMYGGNPVASGSGWTCEGADTCTWPGPVPADGTLPTLTVTSSIPTDSPPYESIFVASVTNADDGFPQNNGDVEVDTPVVKASLLRYLALGDSVPYGHGLANPKNIEENGLPPNQPPSPLAYPSLVAKKLKLSMQVRSTGCTLVGDQLAVSGAPAVEADVTGPDGDCDSTAPHKAVDPDELNAANLTADPPFLVTLQAGADDINFVNCLTYDLTKGVIGTPCVVNGEITTAVQQALSNVQRGLTSIIEQLQAAGAQHIVLLNYYQPIPPPSRISLRQLDNGVCVALKLSASKTYSDSTLLEDSLNSVIASVAKANPEVTFVNIQNLFAGHEMCTGKPYVFEGDDGNLTLNGQYWRTAHPNQTGQAKIAQAVEERLSKP